MEKEKNNDLNILKDPSKLKYIQSELDIEMYKKRKKMYLNEYKNKENVDDILQEMKINAEKKEEE